MTKVFKDIFQNCDILQIVIFFSDDRGKMNKAGLDNFTYAGLSRGFTCALKSVGLGLNQRQYCVCPSPMSIACRML